MSSWTPAFAAPYATSVWALARRPAADDMVMQLPLPGLFMPDKKLLIVRKCGSQVGVEISPPSLLADILDRTGAAATAAGAGNQHVDQTVRLLHARPNGLDAPSTW